MKIDNVTTIKIKSLVTIISYLIGAIGFISVYRYINPLYSVAFVFLFILSMFFQYKQRFYIPKWSLNIFSVLLIAFNLYKINTEELITQIVQVILMIYAVKFLEEKRVRDYMQIYTLTLFLLAGMGLLSMNISFSVFLVIIVIMLSTSFVLLTFYSQEPDMELTKKTAVRIVLKSLYIPCLAIPLSVVMFVILPRTQYPIFDFLNRADKAKTGFTNKVRLGAVTNIQEDASIILRANMEKINNDDLYWRGIVLDFFDGVSWTSTDKNPVPQSSSIIASGKTIKQTIYLEPYADRYLFALDKPAFIYLRGIRRLDDLTFRMPSFIERRLRYDTLSIISDYLFESHVDTKIYLQVPEGISQDIKNLAKSIIKGEDRMQDISSLISFFNSGSFTYSLKNLPITRTPLDDFLFKNRYGNCEYFASACAVMLRLAGIPARLVGGYRGGYYNDVGRYYLVPQKNAHVWVEAFLENKGWVRLDPTPASIDNFALSKKVHFMFRMRLALDLINYYWYAFVINYNLDRQLGIVFAITKAVKRPDLKFNTKTIKHLKYAAMFIMISLLLFIIVKVIMKKRDVERLLLSQFYKRLDRYGYKKRESQGLEEFVEGIKDDNVKTKAWEFTRQFEELYYRDRKLNKDDIKRLKDIIKAI
ncbi:MAG TPA: DUF3488 and transglutaminase-like domain-containing protein [Syntrophorhabdaceae bacterium]|nr:DUF3488 and transglutaminase-like domain-containing protein [Syntrophorhabdaceae bacterium]